ncbi:hypothetical protein ACFV1N_17745 [Streptosporangium canum]|uniref:hypothetical protein n=1 Tax=Streptosporangium canum TaxID=324952 RepID=UPI0036C1C570
MRPSKAGSTSNDTAAAPGGVAVRVLQRILALTAAICHNHHTGQPAMRTLTAYDRCTPWNRSFSWSEA